MSIASITNWAVLLPCLVACAGGSGGSIASPAAARAESGPVASPRASSGVAREAPLDPERLLGSAESIRRDQLGVGVRDERFETDRQVAELRKAVALYRQFIDRAAGDPRYVEAVRRTEVRIEDAEKTIEFLLSEAVAE